MLGTSCGETYSFSFSIYFTTFATKHNMANTFNPADPLAGLPPANIFEEGYISVFRGPAQGVATFTSSAFRAPCFSPKRSGFSDSLNDHARPATLNPRDFPDTKLHQVPFLSVPKWKGWGGNLLLATDLLLSPRKARHCH
jgi:hypothetical protein